MILILLVYPLTDFRHVKAFLVQYCGERGYVFFSNSHFIFSNLPPLKNKVHLINIFTCNNLSLDFVPIV